MSNYDKKITPLQRKKQAWLNQYPFLKADVQSFENQIEEEINRTQRLTSTISPAPARTGVKVDDIWVDVFENIDEIARYYKGLQNEKIRLIREIEEVVGNLEDPAEETIIRLHYLEGLPFKEIVKRVPYSERMIYRYHSQGLDNLKIPHNYL